MYDLSNWVGTTLETKHRMEAIRQEREMDRLRDLYKQSQPKARKPRWIGRWVASMLTLVRF